MKKYKSALLISLAAVITAGSLSGCGMIPQFFDRQSAATEAPSTAAQTTEAASTEPATEKATEAPTTAQPETEAPENGYSTESKGTAVIVDKEKYHDSYLGITFTVPEWVGKAYAKVDNFNGNYGLTFYEKTNYDYGIENDMPGMGMMFTVFVTPEESKGDHIDFPAGSVMIDGKYQYITYFKPTDVRFNEKDDNMAENYRSIYKYQRDYFLSGAVDAEKKYIPSAYKNAVNLKSE